MSIFIELSVIIVIATTIAGIMHYLKQPLIMGHIITGLIVGPQVLGILHSVETFETFSKFGISILLFIVGIGLSPKVIRQVGKVAVITGVGQVLFTTVFGYLIALAFGYNSTSAIIIAIALTFSSTIIILKLLSDRRDLETLHGRIAIGFLLVQDIVAALILVIIGTLNTSTNISYTIALTLLKGIVVTALLIYISYKILPTLEDFIATSQEFLLLFAIGWGFGFASLFDYIGFSIEIGALVAGVTLSVSPYAEEIAAKLKPLRDFFIVTFFVLLGSEMNLGLISSILPQAIVFSAFVLLGNPLIVVILMGLLGYNNKTSFKAGLTVAQISEFSLILVILARELGFINESVLSLVTLVGLITIAGSTYLIIYQDKIYPRLSKYLGLFEKKQPIDSIDSVLSYEAFLFGANRIGYDILLLFNELKISYLAVDFDPEKVKNLTKMGFNCKYGNATDPEFLNELNLEDSKLVISTIQDMETTRFLIKRIRKVSQKTIIIVLTYDLKEALRLYEMGATYVILPHFLSGQFTAMLTAKHWFDPKNFEQEREQHIKYLKERLKLGHKHPTGKYVG